jgi:hypothetical protein
MSLTTKIKYTPEWKELKNNPAALFTHLPCPAEGCDGKAISRDNGKRFACPDCKVVQVIQLVDDETIPAL